MIKISFKVVAFFLLVVTFLSGCALAKNKMVADVEGFSTLVDQAFMDQDIDAIESYVSDSLKVIVHIGGDVHVYDKQGYLALLRGNWDKADSYTYRKLESGVDLAGADKAILREKVVERLIIGAELYTVQSNLLVEVHRINGRLLATQLNAESKLDVDVVE